MANMSPTDQFIGTLSKTPGIAGDLNTNLKKLKDNLDEIIKVLNYSKTIDDDLDKLNNYLSEASELLTIVTIIPEVGEAAVPFKEAISALQPEVKSAKAAADKIEAAVKPFREALQKLDPVLDKLIAGTQKVQDVSKKFLTDFTTVYKCVESLPAGSAKDTSEKYLNDFSTKTEPLVATLNTTMSDANDVINKFYTELDKLKAALNPLAAIDSAIQSVLSKLDPVMQLLQSLENDLKNIKIPVLIPYPMEFSLYDIFKLFGSISALIDEALKPIQDLINKLLSALNINIDIPGLSDILNIHINIPDLPDFTKYFTDITDELQKIIDAITNFTLKCPPDA